MTKIIFFKSHMIKAHASGLIQIIRFTETGRAVFEFPTRFCFDDALSWARRWVDKVKY